jgi:nicotinic acid phosphoribosyltransferase
MRGRGRTNHDARHPPPGGTEIEALRATELFGEEFLAWLAELRFTGDVDAMPEGTVFFANEPLLRVRAPLPEAQLIESRLVNIVGREQVLWPRSLRPRKRGAEPLPALGPRRCDHPQRD